jgi:hypothetical protein
LIHRGELAIGAPLQAGVVKAVSIHRVLGQML